MVEVAPKRSNLSDSRVDQQQKQPSSKLCAASDSSDSPSTSSSSSSSSVAVESANQVLAFLLGHAKLMQPTPPLSSCSSSFINSEEMIQSAADVSFGSMCDDETSSISSISSAQSTCSSNTSHAPDSSSTHVGLEHSQQQQQQEQQQQVEEQDLEDKNQSIQEEEEEDEEQHHLLLQQQREDQHQEMACATLPDLEPITDDEEMEQHFLQPEEEMAPAGIATGMHHDEHDVSMDTKNEAKHPKLLDMTDMLQMLEQLQVQQQLARFLDQVHLGWQQVRRVLLEWWCQQQQKLVVHMNTLVQLIKSLKEETRLDLMAQDVLLWIRAKKQQLTHQITSTWSRLWFMSTELQAQAANERQTGPTKLSMAKPARKLYPLGIKQSRQRPQEPNMEPQVDQDPDLDLVQEQNQPKPTSSPPELHDFISIGCLTLFLVFYLLVCCYRFVNPVEEPFPELDMLLTPTDFTELRVQIDHPINFSFVHAPYTTFNWEIVGFPMQTLQERGPQVVQYQIRIMDSLQDSEVAILSSSLPTRRFSHKLFIDATVVAQAQEKNPWYAQVDVIVPVFGQDEKLVVSEKVFFNVAGAAPNEYEQEQVEPTQTDGSCRIVAPLNGTLVSSEDSFLVDLAYDGLIDNQVTVTVDGNWQFRTSSASSPSFVLHALGLGWHTIQVEAHGNQDAIYRDQVLIQVQDEAEHVAP